VNIGAFELLPGDFNYDGVVDVNELNTELNQVLGSYNNGAADQNVLAAVLARLNGNGTVNQAELNQVLSNYWPSSP
jgi:DNA anti-recombination protein RmuC